MRCSARVRVCVDMRWDCCYITRAARRPHSSYLCGTTNIKGRVGRLIADNEQRILRKYTFELSQIRFS